MEHVHSGRAFQPRWKKHNSYMAMIVEIASWVIQVAVGFRHPKMRYWLSCWAQPKATHSLPYPESERRPSINDFWSCIWGNLNVAVWHKLRNWVIAAISSNIAHGIEVSSAWQLASAAHQPFLVLHLDVSNCRLVGILPKRSNCELLSQNRAWYLYYPNIKCVWLECQQLHVLHIG
jgi:hypothetical protein